MPQAPAATSWPAPPTAWVRDRLTFEGGALLLGEGARLDETADGDAATRNEALLAAAYGKPIEDAALRHVQRALVRKREGNDALALTHLALTGLGKLAQPLEAAKRVAMVDGLIARGVAPKTILAALGLDSATNEIVSRAYNPDQPRVPAGNGDVSGQWTNGDPGVGEGGHQSTHPHAVQIADNSPNWAQVLNPIGEAEASVYNRPPQNGAPPNIQHQQGVDAAVAEYQSRGYTIISNSAVAVDIEGFATPRVYDFIVFDPVAKSFMGIEVKTTIAETIFLNSSQVVKDVALMSGAPATARVSGIKITGVGYMTYCYFCPFIDIRSKILHSELRRLQVGFTHGRFPGETLP